MVLELPGEPRRPLGLPSPAGDAQPRGITRFPSVSSLHIISDAMRAPASPASLSLPASPAVTGFAASPALALGALVALAALAACSSDAVDPDDDGVITSVTRLPEQDPNLTFTIVNNDRLLLDHRDVPRDDLYRPGDILIGAEYGGYLREVISVARENKRLILETRRPALTAALANVHFATSIAPPEAPVVPLLELTDRVVLETSVAGVPVKLTFARAAVQLEPVLELQLDISRRHLDRLAVSLRATATLDVELTLELLAPTGSLSQEVDLSGPFLLYSRPFVVPVDTPLGPLPFAGVLELDVLVGFRAAAASAGAITLAFTGQSAVSLAATWDGAQWIAAPADPAAPGAPSHQLTARSAQLGAPPLLTAELTTYLRPELRARFFGVPGLHATLDPSLKTSVVAAAPSPLVTLEPCAAAKLSIPDALLGETIPAFVHDLPSRCHTPPP